jgi:hypothetical protein
MASRIKNLTMDQGADFIYTTEIYAKKSDIAKLIVDTGDTANAQMRKSYYHVNAIATFGIVMNVDAETVTIALESANTSAIPAGRYVYDLEYTDQNGDVSDLLQNGTNVKKFRALEGIITVTPETTKIG